MKFIERRLFIDKDKEEFYLNDKANHGESFYMKGFTHYLFEETKPQLYTYRIKCVKEKSYQVIKATYEDTYTKVVDFKYPWVTLRRLSEKGPFNRYDDLENRVALYKTTLSYLLLASFILLSASIGLFFINPYFLGLSIISLPPLFYSLLFFRKIGFTNKAIQIKKSSDK